jgi:hypothetical protein
VLSDRDAGNRPLADMGDLLPDYRACT